MLSLLVANATTTVTFTGVTTSTVTKTITAQLPWQFYLIGLLVVVFGVVAWLFFKLQAKDIPVKVDFLQDNYQALEVSVRRNLNGIYLKLMRGGKHVETIKGISKPFEVTILDNKENAWVVDDKRTRMTPEIKKVLEDAGMKLKEVKTNRKKEVKGYLLTEPKPPDKALAYFNVNLGGLKRMTRYMTVQGTGKTIDPMEVYRAATEQVGDGAKLGEVDTSSLTHELLSAGKELVRMINEGMSGNGKLFMGIGIGSMLGISVVLLIMLLSGHLH